MREWKARIGRESGRRPNKGGKVCGLHKLELSVNNLCRRKGGRVLDRICRVMRTFGLNRAMKERRLL